MWGGGRGVKINWWATCILRSAYLRPLPKFRIRETLFYLKSINNMVNDVFNDVSNQQDATTFSFINLFKSAIHVSGDKFAHPQEYFWLYIQLLVQCTDTAAERCHGWDGTSFHLNRSAAMSVHCTKSCIYSQKVLLRMDEFVARNMLGWFKKINKRKKLLYLVGYLHRCNFTWFRVFYKQSQT